MLDFRRIEMSDFPALRKMYEKYGNWSCDCTICGTYMWRDYLDIRISLEEEKLIVYQQLDGKHLFYIPLMEDRIAGIREIVAYMKEQGCLYLRKPDTGSRQSGMKAGMIMSMILQLWQI